ncbi:hypothetical protein [Streptomyces tubercidicus]|uniref:Uncharacterized protein n=1 Tax=Streptomyces tubercidicus TaxID=47759 RepID=A0A640UPK8_9ACTN|nr:hypothetical protein [Streptomyces tubercidicus]WAU11395.1 hypothetical protein STRTU_001599 [Streptomyces tubercidicus]GFE36651.1 hypothetical protein Stube_13240 [Streptomyces tubercidicus]
MTHSHRTFENPPALPHDVVAKAVERALDDSALEAPAAVALVGIALNDDDRAFIEHCCIKVGSRAAAGSQLLGLAGLCLGHTARRFGQLSDRAVALAESLATRAELDPSDVDGRALDGLDDIRSFLRRDDAEQFR